MKIATLLPFVFATAMIVGGAQANDEVLLKSCKEDLKLSESGCACVMEKIANELSDKQRNFLVASISNDQQAMQQGFKELTGQEMMDVTTFMTQTPMQCQNQ